MQRMKHIFEIGLIGGVMLATLAFGGTEMPYFSIVQITFLGLGVLIPLSLVVFVLLQCVHLLGSKNSLDGASLSGISVAPYETLSHLLVLVTYLAAFYLTFTVVQQPDGGARLGFALLGLGTFESCYGLFQYLTGWQRIFYYEKT